MYRYKELLRRFYHDLVLRRSTVRVIPSLDEFVSVEPIFLIGTYRSGTTLLRYIIDSHSNISCPPESNFISPLSQLLTDPTYQRSLERMGFDKEHVTSKIRELCNYFFCNYASSFGKQRWADKTPLYIRHLQFLRFLYPESRFIMIYRNPLDQVHSYTRGGTYCPEPLLNYMQKNEDLRIAAVQFWNEQIDIMLDFEETYPLQCFRIRYEDLCIDPENLLKSLFYFVGEPWESQVLRFYDFPHDKGNEDGRIIGTRSISISYGHYLSWPNELKQECLSISKQNLKNLKYNDLLEMV